MGYRHQIISDTMISGIKLPKPFIRHWKNAIDFKGNYWKTHSEVKLHLMDGFFGELNEIVRNQGETVSFMCWADESSENHPDVVFVRLGEEKVTVKQADGWVAYE